MGNVETANLLAVVAIFITALGVGTTYRLGKRANDRDMARDEQTRIHEAEERGRQEALRDARMTELERQLRQQQGDGQE